MDFNEVKLTGTVASEIKRNDIDGNCTFELSIPRTSGTEDTLPITMPIDLAEGLNAGDDIKLTGTLRSYNKLTDGKSKLILTINAATLDNDLEDNNNIIKLCGFLCKPPVYRCTPLGKEITDMLIAVNNNETANYVPAICWGQNAVAAKNLKVGDNIELSGRMQSRAYSKMNVNTQTLETRVAYEMSVNSVSVIDDIQEYSKNKAV